MRSVTRGARHAGIPPVGVALAATPVASFSDARGVSAGVLRISSPRQWSIASLQRQPSPQRQLLWTSARFEEGSLDLCMRHHLGG